MPDDQIGVVSKPSRQIGSSFSACLSSRVCQVAIIVTLSIAVRLILFMNFPVALTADSWDYLSAAEGLYHRADFNSYAFRDIRLPVYPVFLAVTYPLTGMRADLIALLQIVVGVFNVVLGMIIGYRLGSKLAAIGLGLWLGLSPVYLLNEHMVMTETLCLFGLLLFTLIAISCVNGELNGRKGLAGGLAMALCALIRVNTLPFCLVLLCGALVYHRMTLRASGQVIPRRAGLTFLVAVLAGVSLLMGPWLWRNFTLYHNISLANFNNRNVLIFKVMHNRLDMSLPKLQRINESLGSSTIDFAWLFKLSSAHRTSDAESIAGELFWEQVTAHPLWYLLDVAESALNFGGFSEFTGNDRTAVLYWFMAVVNNPKQWYQINTPSWAASRAPDFKNVFVIGEAFWGRLWSVAGQFYLRVARPVLYVISMVLIAIYFGQKRLNALKVFRLSERFIVLLTGGYLVTVLLHAVTLLDGDRYTSLFDWVAVLLVLLIGQSYSRSRVSHLQPA